MKISDLEYTVKDVIKSVKDEYMIHYIQECLDNAFLYHNTNSDKPYYFTEVQKNYTGHKANEMNADIEFIGGMMEDKFGYDYRNHAIYTTFYGESQYGNKYLVLPYGGKYQMCYSGTVHDMFFNYHEVKMKIYEDIYQHIKSGWCKESLDEDILSKWDKFEHTVQGMQATLDDYRVSLINLNVSETSIKILMQKFNELIYHYYEKIMLTYKLSNSITSTFTDIGQNTKPTTEIMLVAPKYLMINTKYIVRKYSKSPQDFLKQFL